MINKLKKLTLLLAALSLVSIVCATRAEADYTISIDASANGFHMVYHLPLIATGFVNLKEGDAAKTINLSFLFIPIAKLELSVVSSDVVPTETHPLPTLKLHYIVTAASMAEPMESDIDVPWCTAGIEIGLFKALGLPVLADKDIKAFFLLKKESSHYDVSVTTAAITGAWSGDATSANPTVTAKDIEFKVDGQVVSTFDVQLSFGYSTPLFTQVDYSIPMPTTPYTGTLTLPNGRYKLWIDFNK